MHIHGTKGHKGKSYLDDQIGVSLPVDASRAYDNLGSLLVTLGLEENGPKACPPAAVQIVLGVLFDTMNFTISVTPERLEEIRLLLGEWKLKTKCTKTELRSLLGNLCSVIKCVRQSRVLINRLLTALRSFPQTKYMSVPDDMVKDIQWWLLFMRDYNVWRIERY